MTLRREPKPGEMAEEALGQLIFELTFSGDPDRLTERLDQLNEEERDHLEQACWRLCGIISSKLVTQDEADVARAKLDRELAEHQRQYGGAA